MPAAISARKPRGQGAARREEILAAAKRLFVEKGYEQATMRRIAAEVGVSAAALYGYFPDKDAMLRAIAEEAFGELLARLEESQRGDAPPLDRFKAGLRAYNRMTRLAVPLVAPGGFLFVASCSHHAPLDLFGAQVAGGLLRARREARIVHTGGAGPDHPVHPHLPESAYLKSLLMQVT